jgi:alkaline phosphatase D
MLEITSSGLNRVSRNIRRAGSNPIDAPYRAVNFGTIDLDWDAGTITLSLRGLTGSPVRRQIVRLDELRKRDK